MSKNDNISKLDQFLERSPYWILRIRVSELDSLITEAIEIMLKANFDLRGWEFTHDSAENDSTLVFGVLFKVVRD